jgi:hypothetical protein
LKSATRRSTSRTRRSRSCSISSTSTRWHLDERPLRADNEINPDVVGYIFEKYINQKQMGAYYTKEDITEYISKNTIIPFLFDAAEKKCPSPSKPDSPSGGCLRDDPDRYIYAAVGHGVTCDYDASPPGSPTVGPTALPAEIAAGRPQRGEARTAGTNRAGRICACRPRPGARSSPAANRCLELRAKLKAGEVHSINDLITLNLDIWQFARDAIVNSEGPELLRAPSGTPSRRSPCSTRPAAPVRSCSPRCGSWSRCTATAWSGCGGSSKIVTKKLLLPPKEKVGVRLGVWKIRDFKAVLARLADHANERYFILKSIIIGNLFGVDIMEEAVEICKLRLFLKLVAQVETADQIEPLPDIDFNIRAGNTLVGFAETDYQIRLVGNTIPMISNHLATSILRKCYRGTKGRRELDSLVNPAHVILFLTETRNICVTSVMRQCFLFGRWIYVPL